MHGIHQEGFQTRIGRFHQARFETLSTHSKSQEQFRHVHSSKK